MLSQRSILALTALVTLMAGAAQATPKVAALPPETFVLIVTNNRSSELGRPDLSYADDDGAKYYEMFRSAVPAAHVHLLTELDRDTVRLFPTLATVVRPPTRAAVAAAVAGIAMETAEARRVGRDVELVFVFAGHGDVDAGRGFLELRDGPFRSEDLEAMLAKIGATRSHVILDSCNSFFVINARKPGGRRFATPKDAVDSLSKRFPNVGVFLSTSAESEVFEWSELQSGIFSHAVRSGLSGAADADGDGTVSYEELAAFVDAATSGIKNPSYRPKVYARGPNGGASSALFSPGRQQAARLELDRDRQVRLTIRDADDLPWIDVFKAAGAPMVLHLPPRLEHGTLEELEVTATGTRAQSRHGLEVSAGVATTTLALVDKVPAARGPSELFRMLFTQAFGPQTIATYRAAEANEQAPVFGISREDAERMSLLLTEIGEVEHRGRITGTSALIGLGGVGVAAGLWLHDRTIDGSTVPPAVSYGLIGGGAAIALAGGVGLFVRSPAEQLRQRFVRGLAAGGDPAVVVADTERRLAEVAADYRRTRMVMRWTGFGIAATASALLVVNEVRDRPSHPELGALALVGGWAAISSFYEYPIERMARLWRADPGIRRLPSLSVAPTTNGFVIGASGQF